MTPLPAFPGTSATIAQQDRRPTEVYSRLIKQLLDALRERDEQIETLRVALNEVRQNPGTTYPIIPNF